MCRKPFLRVLSVVVLAFHFSSCASVQKSSLFLKETPIQEGKDFKYEFVASDANFGKYRKVKVDLVELEFLQKKASYSPKDLEDLAFDLRAELEKRLWEEYQVVGQGEDADVETLVIQPALVYLRSAKPLLNLITAVLIFVPVSMGSAGFEARLVDGGSGRVVAQLSEKRTAGVFTVKSLLIDPFLKYAHAKTAFKRWGEQLTHFLQDKSVA